LSQFLLKLHNTRTLGQLIHKPAAAQCSQVCPTGHIWVVSIVAVRILAQSALLLCAYYRGQHCCCAHISTVSIVAVRILSWSAMLLCAYYRGQHCYSGHIIVVSIVAVSILSWSALLLWAYYRGQHCYIGHIIVVSIVTVGILKGKAAPFQTWSGPEGSRKLSVPDYMTTTQDGRKVVSLTHRPPLPSGNAPGTHFC
jgi:hypothetical protein